jgi:hypothetical protein
VEAVHSPQMHISGSDSTLPYHETLKEFLELLGARPPRLPPPRVAVLQAALEPLSGTQYFFTRDQAGGAGKRSWATLSGAWQRAYLAQLCLALGVQHYARQTRQAGPQATGGQPETLWPLWRQQMRLVWTSEHIARTLGLDNPMRAWSAAMVNATVAFGELLGDEPRRRQLTSELLGEAPEGLDPGLLEVTMSGQTAKQIERLVRMLELEGALSLNPFLRREPGSGPWGCFALAVDLLAPGSRSDWDECARVRMRPIAMSPVAAELIERNCMKHLPAYDEMARVLWEASAGLPDFEATPRPTPPTSPLEERLVTA